MSDTVNIHQSHFIITVFLNWLIEKTVVNAERKTPASYTLRTYGNDATLMCWKRKILNWSYKKDKEKGQIKRTLCGKCDPLIVALQNWH